MRRLGDSGRACQHQRRGERRQAWLIGGGGAGGVGANGNNTTYNGGAGGDGGQGGTGGDGGTGGEGGVGPSDGSGLKYTQWNPPPTHVETTGTFKLKKGEDVLSLEGFKYNPIMISTGIGWFL